jgi:hypothetical protein
MRKFLLATVLLLGSVPAYAVEKECPVPMTDLKYLTCSQFVVGMRTFSCSGIMGAFILAEAYTAEISGQMPKLPDRDRLTLMSEMPWIAAWCDAHSQSHVASAVDALRMTLTKQYELAPK